MERVVLAQGLRKHFGTTHAVADVNIEVLRGQSVGLLGPNGAGKTTTLLMLLGAISADAGTIEVLGHSMPKRRSEAMNQVGFAAGYLPMPGRLSVMEALQFFGRLYGISKPDAKITHTLDRLGIGHLLRQPINTLSSGQRTLVGIAKAILHEPALLVLDEPTASLDPDIADRVRDTVASLNGAGVTLLLTSHDMSEVEALCERVLFIQHGTVVSDGSPEQLAEHYGEQNLHGVFLQVARKSNHREFQAITMGNTSAPEDTR